MEGAAAALTLFFRKQRRVQARRLPLWGAAALLVGALAGGAAALGSAADARELASLSSEQSHPAPVPAASIAEPTGLEQDPSDFRGKRPTPMKPRRAAQVLCWAWHQVTGRRARPETVALLWAHWALETGRGTRMVDYNFAGLKGRAPGGASSVVWTRERGETGKTRVRARFRAYSTAEEGACDYVRMLHARFDSAFVAASEGDVQQFVNALDEAGYFTEKPTAYRRAMQSLVREYLDDFAAH
jgi:flagellar protein FlgJ